MKILSVLFDIFLIGYIATCLILQNGCVALNYSHPKYGDLEYRRLWNQEVQDVYIVINGEIIGIGLGKQNSEAPDLETVIGSAIKYLP